MTERYVWLDIATGRFSNSWTEEEFLEKGIDIDIKRLCDDVSPTARLIKYTCENNEDFEFCMPMRLA